MRVMMAFAIALGCIAAPAAQASRRDLTAAEAVTLVRAYLDPPQAGWSWDVGPARDRFYTITMINPAPGAQGVDLYEVDRRTGDLWRSSICRHLDNTRLRAAQHRLWRRISLRYTGKRHLRRPGECR